MSRRFDRYANTGEMLLSVTYHRFTFTDHVFESILILIWVF